MIKKDGSNQIVRSLTPDGTHKMRLDKHIRIINWSHNLNDN